MHSHLPLIRPYIDHDHAKELQVTSDILDEAPQIMEWVYADLIRGGITPDRDRERMTAERVLRALIVKQTNGFNYEG